MADSDSGLAASSTPSVSDEAVQVAAREMEAFARLIDDTRAETKSYGRDLEQSASTLSHMDASTPVAEIIRFTGALIERTRATERCLAEAVWEASSRREERPRAREEAKSYVLATQP